MNNTNKKTVEECVSELTEEQKDGIYSFGKKTLIVELAVMIPWFIMTFIGLFTIIDPPLGFDMANYGKLVGGYVFWCLIGFAFFVGMMVYIKKKCPLYSDAVWNYIHKERKNSK